MSTGDVCTDFAALLPRPVAAPDPKLLIALLRQPQATLVPDTLLRAPATVTRSGRTIIIS